MTTFRPPRAPLVPPGGTELHARDMTATFAADVSLRAAQEELARLRQWLPVDGDPKLPLGDLVASNSTGPLRLGFGAWRDVLLGVQFLNGRGELISAGGRTVKNVAGYDLTKFMVGSAGVFGRIATITIRTWRRPEKAILARHAPDPRKLNALITTPLRPQWAVLTEESLLLGYLGDQTTIDYYRTALPQSEPLEIQERGVDADISHRARLWSADGAMEFRASVPPARIQHFVARSAVRQWAADPAFGIVLGSADSDGEADIVRAAASAVGGSVRFTARPSRALLDISTNPLERQIIERLKHAFDPDGVLNPLPWQIR